MDTTQIAVNAIFEELSEQLKIISARAAQKSSEVAILKAQLEDAQNKILELTEKLKEN